MSQTNGYDLRGPILILAAAVLLHGGATSGDYGIGLIALGLLVGFAGLCFMSWVKPKAD